MEFPQSSNSKHHQSHHRSLKGAHLTPAHRAKNLQTNKTLGSPGFSEGFQRNFRKQSNAESLERANIDHQYYETREPGTQICPKKYNNCGFVDHPQPKTKNDNKIFVIYDNPNVTGFQIARIFERFGKVKNVFFGSKPKNNARKSKNQFASGNTQSSNNSPSDSFPKKDVSYVFVTFHCQEHVLNAVRTRQLNEMNTKFTIKQSNKKAKKFGNKKPIEAENQHSSSFFKELGITPPYRTQSNAHHIQNDPNFYWQGNQQPQLYLPRTNYSEKIRAFKAALLPQRLNSVNLNQVHENDNLVLNTNSSLN